MSCRTSSQIWSSWNLPRFLLRDGSLTLMNIAYLMILTVPCASLPTMEKILYTDAMIIYVGGCPEMFLKSVPKVFPDTPMFSSLHSAWAHLNLQSTPLLGHIGKYGPSMGVPTSPFDTQSIPPLHIFVPSMVSIVW